MSILDDSLTRSSESDLAPERWFTLAPGTEGALIDRDAMRGWLEQLSREHDHVAMRSIGISTEGRSLDALFVGDEIARHGLDAIECERHAHVESLLRGTSPTEASLPVVLITSGIHATEVGGPQCIPELVWWIASAPEAAQVRKRVLTIIVPTLNPDGFDLVTRWNRESLGTAAQGTNPPLLYHRFAGHDNNRDWLFRNLSETRAVLDRIHARWLPHVTLDQHQMSRTGPRFALPPYADPWEPHIHPHIIAASNALGQAVASDMTLAGFRGVVTGRYFDAWEPSRALQHYRGGIRILAEAASAALAHPVDIDQDELVADPLSQPMAPSSDCPAPWPGGRWRLRDIMDQHLAAARSLLKHIADDPDRWISVQHAALSARPPDPITFTVPAGGAAIDRAANRQLAEMLDRAGASSVSADCTSYSTDQPKGPLLDALLRVKAYPDEFGSTAYDLTTHHLPLLMGATVRAGEAPFAENAKPDRSGRYLLIDARTHAAPEAIEPALRHDSPALWRTTARAVANGQLIEPGTWVIDRDGHPTPDAAEALAYAATDVVPGNASLVQRRDVVLLNIADEPSEDHGWTRWWLHQRTIPFLEAEISRPPDLEASSPTATMLIPDTSRSEVSDAAVRQVGTLLAAGATVIAFGASGRILAKKLATGVGSPDLTREGTFRSPGALVRLQPQPGTELALGLDRSIPTMFQRDGVFAVSRAARNVDVLARFSARDTLVSGWMSSVAPIRNAPAVLRIRHGSGILYTFAFRPLFRGQTLVTAPLLHNLLYTSQEPESCPPSAPGKTRAGSTSGRMS